MLEVVGDSPVDVNGYRAKIISGIGVLQLVNARLDQFSDDPRVALTYTTYDQNHQAVIHKLSYTNFAELKKAMEAFAVDKHAPIHIWEITEYRDNK
ncbi:hypothetical protein ABTN81_19250, partial [Acinetobacter baumannii]